MLNLFDTFGSVINEINGCSFHDFNRILAIYTGRSFGCNISTSDIKGRECTINVREIPVL